MPVIDIVSLTKDLSRTHTISLLPARQCSSFSSNLPATAMSYLTNSKTSPETCIEGFVRWDDGVQVQDDGLCRMHEEGVQSTIAAHFLSPIFLVVIR